MSKKIYGVTVGTPISPKVIREKLKPVTSVNGIEADENGNVNVDGCSTNITINGKGPDKDGNFVINTLNDVEIAQLDATLIGGMK